MLLFELKIDEKHVLRKRFQCAKIENVGYLL